MHWADEASLEWLNGLADRTGQEGSGLNLLVLIQTRPDSALMGPEFGKRVNLTPITLGPLARDASLAVAAAVLSATQEGLPETVQSLIEQVLARAEGNPFYLSELLRSLIDGGVLVRQGATWGMGAPAGEFRLPTNVQGAVAAHLDRLRADLRRVIQVAAVIGRSFDKQLLARVAGREAGQAVDGLTARGFRGGGSPGTLSGSCGARTSQCRP
jgi:predicted ATPase